MSETKTQPRKPYATPVLEEIGSFASLTQGSMGSFNDGNDGGGAGAGMADLAEPPGNGSI